jgi:hypothetical protein
MSGDLSRNISQSESPAAGRGHGYGQHAPAADVGVPPRLVDMLAQTQPWVRFMSVLMFIGSGLCVAGGIVLVSVGGTRRGGGSEIMAALLYVVMGLLFLIPAGFLRRYAHNIRNFRSSLRIPDLENALEAQKSYWKFIGTWTLVLLVFFVLLVVPAMFFAATRTRGS